MNIREIEQQLGIPRANIRYYEKEGLLHPQRSANNYRVYTEKDLETLKKIRLLRQLDMPVETIRAVQTGEVLLADALARQERLLESEAVKLDQARAVCRSMLEDGAAYPALDPARYEPLTLPGRAAEPPKPERPPVEGAQWAFNPWQRYWARTFDVGLAYGIVGAVLALAFHVSAANTNTALLRVILCVLGWALELVLEPLLLCTWGTTPGKWLLGLELRNARGEKLSFSEGLKRTWGVLWTGYGFEIPFYSWYRMYHCYKECRKNKPLDYDYEEDFLYYSRAADRWGWRAFVSVGLSLLLVPAQVWCAFQAILPPNRGEVTAAEFAENVNAVAERLNGSLWVNEEGFALADQTADILTDGKWEKRRYGEPFEDTPVYTVETDGNGYVTAVCIEREGRSSGENADWTWLPAGSTAQTVILAFQGAWRSGYDTLRGPLMEALGQGAEAWDGRAVQDGAFSQTIALEQKGYWLNDFGSALLIPEEDVEECWYHFVLRLEKTG